MGEHADEAATSARLVEMGEGADGLEAQRVRDEVRHRLFGGGPTRFGRFVVLKRLGEGASGVVYAGYDPELDRKVAIKVLRGEGHREGTLREAKAMGRLRHPNVVGVHQLGTHEGHVFLAMEYVEGTTLRTWMAETHRWPVVLDVFLRAGRGLAAAHAADLVHCDFKPANVLLTEEGDVRVADFGLARYVDGPVPTSSAPDVGPLEPTRTGAITGTPAYMAPELFDGAAPTPQSDQFSFCVTLYEALYGVRPFAGDTLTELAAAVQAGDIAEPPTLRSVPASLRRAVERGLATEPADRFEDVASLLRALEAARSHRRKGVVAAVAAVGALLVGAGALAFPASPALCEGSEAELAGVWDPARKQALTRAFQDVGVPYADDALRVAGASLDAYAESWVAMHRSACEATQIHGTQSERALDLRMACLGRRRSQLLALSDVLIEADAGVVQNAVEAAEALVPVEVCADVATLEAGDLIPEDPTVRNRVDDLRRSLDAVVQQGAAGRTGEALAKARELATQADDLDFGPFRAEAHLELARLQEAEGELEEAEASLEQAFSLGLAHGHDEVAARAAIEATDLVGKQRHEPEAGHRWARLAEPIADRAGGSSSMVAAMVMARANVHWAEGSLGEAKRGYERALELLLAAHGPTVLVVAKVRHNLGAALRKLGHAEEALEQLQEAERIMKARVGEQHPSMTRVLNSIGNLHWSTKDFPRAVAYHRRALDVKTAILTAGHPSLGHSHNNLADALIEMARHEEAATHYRAALANWEKALDDDHPLLAFPLRGLGRVAIETGRGEEAIEPLERALDLVMARKSSELYRAETAWLLAQALEEREPERALTLAEDALTRLEKSPEPGAERVAKVKAWLKAHGRGQQPPSDVSIR